MATPLPSPIANNYTISALQTAEDDSLTPCRPSTAATWHSCTSKTAASVSQHHSGRASPLAPIHPARSVSAPYCRLLVALQSPTRPHEPWTSTPPAMESCSTQVLIKMAKQSHLVCHLRCLLSQSVDLIVFSSSTVYGALDWLFRCYNCGAAEAVLTFW
jgi:hypothetical protein